MSDDSGGSENHDGEKEIIYLTTNMLAPAKQPINEITVDTLGEDEIKGRL